MRVLILAREVGDASCRAPVAFIPQAPAIHATWAIVVPLVHLRSQLKLKKRQILCLNQADHVFKPGLPEGPLSIAEADLLEFWQKSGPTMCHKYFLDKKSAGRFG